MYCQRCGKDNDTQNTICTECANNFTDKGGFKYGLLGFLFPIAAIILYYLLSDTEPNLCNSLKIGAILFVSIIAIFYILHFAILFLAILSL